jgi:hypothetical protein
MRRRTFFGTLGAAGASVCIPTFKETCATNNSFTVLGAPEGANVAILYNGHCIVKKSNKDMEVRFPMPDVSGETDVIVRVRKVGILPFESTVAVHPGKPVTICVPVVRDPLI